jgi:hypothetical protein
MPPIEAASMVVTRCESCGYGMVCFEAEDGRVFARGHIDAEQIRTLIEYLQELLRLQ